MGEFGDTVQVSWVEDEVEPADALNGRTTEGDIQQLAEDFGSEWNLSPRQRDVFKLAIAGVHRKESAALLACSLKTIEGYWKRIYEKTGCFSQAEVVAKFIREVLLADLVLANDAQVAA